MLHFRGAGGNILQNNQPGNVFSPTEKAKTVKSDTKYCRKTEMPLLLKEYEKNHHPTQPN